MNHKNIREQRQLQRLAKLREDESRKRYENQQTLVGAIEKQLDVLHKQVRELDCLKEHCSQWPTGFATPKQLTRWFDHVEARKTQLSEQIETKNQLIDDEDQKKKEASAELYRARKAWASSVAKSRAVEAWLTCSVRLAASAQELLLERDQESSVANSCMVLCMQTGEK